MDEADVEWLKDLAAITLAGGDKAGANALARAARMAPGRIDRDITPRALVQVCPACGKILRSE